MGSFIKYVRTKGGGGGGGWFLPKAYVYCLNLGIILSKSGEGVGVKFYVFERTYFMDDPYM